MLLMADCVRGCRSVKDTEKSTSWYVQEEENQCQNNSQGLLLKKTIHNLNERSLQFIFQSCFMLDSPEEEPRPPLSLCASVKAALLLSLWARGSLFDPPPPAPEPVKVGPQSGAHARPSRRQNRCHLIHYELIHAVTACRPIRGGSLRTLRHHVTLPVCSRPLQRGANPPNKKPTDEQRRAESVRKIPYAMNLFLYSGVRTARVILREG